MREDAPVGVGVLKAAFLALFLQLTEWTACFGASNKRKGMRDERGERGAHLSRCFLSVSSLLLYPTKLLSCSVESTFASERLFNRFQIWRIGLVLYT